MYLQRRASLEEQHILDAEDVQETKPTSSDYVLQELTLFNGLLEIRRCQYMIQRLQISSVDPSHLAIIG
jgi:hypothetical protein